MARFKDSTGFEWDLRLNFGVLPDLKRAGCDLENATKDSGWLAEVLFGEPGRLADVFWVLLGEQAQRAGLDRDAFNRRLDVETFDAGGRALLDEVIDFFQRGRAGQIKKRLPRILAAMEGKLDDLTEEATEKAVSAFTTSGGNSPGSSGSTPAP
jgi:hypothetical protein